MVKDHQWFHQITLPDGSKTPGIVDCDNIYSTRLFNKLDFKDKTVLDMACFDGYYTFKAEERGAKMIVPLDGVPQPGFDFVADQLDSRAEFIELGASKWDEFLAGESFDIVLCMGILYHVSDPLKVLSTAFQAADETVFVEGVMMRKLRPVLELLAPGAINGDTSNVFRLSYGFVEAVGALHGFKIREYEFFNDRAAILLDRKTQPKELYHPRIWI